jgi:hypothetical protein
MKRLPLLPGFLLLCLPLLWLPGVARAEPPPAEAQGLASLLPPETMFVVELDDLGGFDRWSKETALGRIWAEPEVRHFVKGLEKAVTEAMAQWQQGFNPLGMIGLTEEDFQGIRFRRGGFALVDASFDGRVHVDAVMTLQLRSGGENAAKVFAGLRRGLETFSPLAFEETELAGRKVLRLPLSEQMQLWTLMQGDRFVLATKRERLERMIMALDGKAQGACLRDAPRFAHLMKRMGADRRGILVYADVARLHARGTEAARNLGQGGHVEEFDAAWRKLGLDAVQAIGFADIPAGTGWRTELAITMTERRGLFGFFPSEPPSHRFAKYAPAGALLYGGERFDAAQAWSGVLDLAGSFDADARAELERGERQAGAMLGVDIRQDLLQALGTEWAAYVGSPPGGGLIPDLVLFVTVRDRARLEKALLTIADRMQPVAEEERVRMKVRDTHFRGTHIRYLELAEERGDPIPVAPAWAFGEDFVVFALYPQTIKNALLDKPSLAANEDFRACLRHLPKSAVSSTYIDLRGLVGWIYNTATPFLQVLQGAINREVAQYGLEINLQDLPPAEVITRHLSGAVTYTAVENDCVRMGVVSPFGAPMLVAPVALLAATAAVLTGGPAHAHREAVAAEAHRARAEAEAVRRAEQQQRASELEKLRAQNRLLRERLARIERQIEELKKLLEEPTKRK